MAFHLNLGPPSIARAWCALCGEETLHKYSQCIHHDSVMHPSTTAKPSPRTSYRLTPETRREIRRRVGRKQLTKAAAAREYGVSEACVYALVRGGA